MHNFFVLRMLDFFQPLFTKLKIDYPLLRNILAVKLLMDQRRSPTILGDANKQNRNPFINSLWIYALYGLILVFFVFGEAYMLQMSIIFGVALFILMTSLIADFSSVILDTRDQVIMRTKPVDSKTMGVAKFIHIFIYLTLLTGAFTVIPIMFMLFVQGFVFTLVFILMLILFMFFVMALTTLIYIFTLRFFSGEKLKNMVNYIQILFAVGIIVGYQVIIRTYGYVDSQADYIFKWWHAALPPFWFAAPFELIMNHNFSIPIIVLTLLSIIVSLITIVLYYRVIPAFEANLQKLLETSEHKNNQESLLEKLWKKLLCKTKKATVYFQFVYRMAQREREFKLRVYPSLGIGVVLPFIFLASIVGINSFEDIQMSNSYFYIYLMHIFIGIALYTFQFSDNFKGAWIFNMADKNTAIELRKAVMKVFIVKLYVPMFLLVGIGYYLIFTQFHLVDLVIVFAGALIQALLSYQFIMNSDYPFSLSFSLLADEGNTIKAVLLMLLVIPFVVLHFLSTLVSFGSLFYAILLIVIVVLLWKSFFKTNEQ